MYRFSVWLFIFEKKQRHILLDLFLSPSWGYKGRKGRDEAPKPCCFNKACPSKITGMSLRDQQDTIVCSPLLRPAASTSLNLYPEDPLSSKKDISRKSKNSVIDRSVDDGTSKQLESYFQERRPGCATKPLDWTKLRERGAAEIINKQWHTLHAGTVKAPE